MKKKITPAFIIFLVSLTCIAFAQPKFTLGSVASVYDALANAKITASQFEFRTNAGSSLNVNITDYYSDGAYLSISGTAKDAKKSLFILKGNRSSLYGYIAIHDTKIAYEYTTVSSNVIVNEVPIAKIFPDQYEEEMPFPHFEATQDALTAPQGQFDYSPMALHQAPHIGTYQNEDVRKLQSKPGSPKVLWLDISGVMNGDTPQTNTKDDMFRMWECVSAQYSMYDINVTTDQTVYNSVPVSSSGIMKFNPGGDRPNAPLHVFGTNQPGTMYIDYTPSSKPHYAAAGRTCAHELGHVMGLSHDGGGSGGEYFEGLPAVQWVPTMGNYWYGDSWAHGLYQWSKGEYNTANNQEDDLQIMINDGLSYRPDDIPTTKALVVPDGTTVDPAKNWGQIEKNIDTDTWTFSLATDGHLKLNFDPIEILDMLDIDVTLLDGNGKQVAQNNLPVNRSAALDLDLKSGNYQIVIKGGAELTPQTGFSNYSSLGFYAMQGTITGGITGVEKSLLENSISIYPNPTSDVTYFSIPTDAKVTHMILTSIEGKVVFDSPSRVSSIDLSGFNKGIYFLKIEANHETINHKVVKY